MNRSFILFVFWFPLLSSGPLFAQAFSETERQYQRIQTLETELRKTRQEKEQIARELQQLRATLKAKDRKKTPQDEQYMQYLEQSHARLIEKETELREQNQKLAEENRQLKRQLAEIEYKPTVTDYLLFGSYYYRHGYWQEASLTALVTLFVPWSINRVDKRVNRSIQQYRQQDQFLSLYLLTGSEGTGNLTTQAAGIVFLSRSNDAIKQLKRDKTVTRGLSAFVLVTAYTLYVSDINSKYRWKVRTGSDLSDPFLSLSLEYRF